MSDDASRRGLRRRLRDHHIAELLVLITQSPILQLPMQRRTLHSGGEMTPIVARNWTRRRCGTRSQDRTTASDQLISNRANQREPARSSRLNCDERRARGLPQTGCHRHRLRAQLPQRICRHHQIVRRKRSRFHQIAGNHGRARQKSPRRIAKLPVPLQQRERCPREQFVRSQRRRSGPCPCIEHRLHPNRRNLGERSSGSRKSCRHPRG